MGLDLDAYAFDVLIELFNSLFKKKNRKLFSSFVNLTENKNTKLVSIQSLKFESHIKRHIAYMTLNNVNKKAFSFIVPNSHSAQLR